MINTLMYIYFYALIIQVFILGYTLWATSKKTMTTWLFVNSIFWNIAVLFFEAVSWPLMTVSEPWAVKMNFIMTTILYSINMMPMFSIFLYFDHRVLQDKKIKKYRRIGYGMIIAVMLALNFTNYRTGFLFRISDENVYSRGPGMYLTVGLSLFVLLAYGISMIRYRKSIEGRIFSVIMIFTTLPIIGSIIQALYYGIPAMWTMFILLSLFIFIFVEREDMMRDTLTNLVTRGQFEQRLKKKLKTDKPFTLIMVDMDYFKTINDTYGHEEGDQVLIVVASILEHSIKHIDMASRYGGDEFMLLIESSTREVEVLVRKRITEAIQGYNDKKIKPYKIQLSMGAYYISEPKKVHYQEVVTRVDTRMYREKKLRQKVV